MSAPLIVSYNGQFRGVIRAQEDFGFKTFDLLAPPRRLLGSDSIQPLVEAQVDGRRVQPLPTPAALLQSGPEVESWMSLTQRTMSRLFAAFLVAEDPQRRLDASKATTLMHQVSLVQHILEHSNLRKVLIADEVGLGKTIEAGLLIKRLIEQRPDLRVLYLAPARLVTNVASEFRDKLDLDARAWIAGSASDARVANDRIVIASIHKAVFGDNLQKVVEAGPWDVLIVDECHHLSDWGIDGGKPTQSFKLVDQLVQSMPPSGRLILMSGTPHQGSVARFKNLLRLLSDNRDVKSAAGRVIFRTKDMVSDWKNQPLFPSRQIRAPTLVSLGSVYERWYDSVGELYDSFIVPGSRGRATGWAKSQALQWAASSVHAGLGFLCRLGIRRLGWDLENEVLRAALAELRPYRGGAPDEPLQNLFVRICKQIGIDHDTSESDDEEDEQDALFSDWKPAPEALERLLVQGVELIRSSAAAEKWTKLAELIDQAGDEKIVLFAQPVETVTVVADFLKRRYGESPCFIIGNQSDEERRQQVALFQSPSGPRFLVSSRAGGEGLNMQRARRLIHLDVPWNPMELEQRIGRIHRFGSRKTIIVDTLVVAGSREVEMYRIARDKLRLITKQLDPDQFDTLFSRVMSLVAPKELGEVMIDLGPGPVTPAAADEIGALVKNGYTAWQEFNDLYRSNAQRIQSTSGGEATWLDVGNHLRRQGEASLGPNTSQTRFTFKNDEIVAVDEELPTLKINGRLYACGDSGGLPPNNVDGQSVLQLGLNVTEVSASLKSAFLGDKPSGAAYLKRPISKDLMEIPPSTFGVLCFLKQTIRYENDRAAEERTSLHSFLVNDSDPVRLDAVQQASLMRELVDATRIREPVKSDLETKMLVSESEIANSLRELSEADIENRVRHVVLPLGAIIVV
jgi:superfamily II DNA or RNA helicase